MLYQYCHPARVLGVGVESIKLSPVEWLAHSLWNDASPGSKGKESVLELTFPFSFPLFFSETTHFVIQGLFYIGFENPVYTTPRPNKIHLLKVKAWQCWCNTLFTIRGYLFQNTVYIFCGIFYCTKLIFTNILSLTCNLMGSVRARWINQLIFYFLETVCYHCLIWMFEVGEGHNSQGTLMFR